MIGAVSLYLFGAEPLQMFPLAIFLGLVCGEVSSLLIGPQVWLALHPSFVIGRARHFDRAAPLTRPGDGPIG
jgi:preprotein translocase subunit SecF